MSKITLDERAEIKMAFRNLDPDKTDIISRKDFKVALNSMFFYPKDEEIEEWCPNETISYRDFKTIVIPLIKNRDPANQIKRFFHLFDQDRDGYISSKDLQNACKMCGDKSTHEFIKRMVTDFDSNGRGKISEREFLSIFAY